jgi:predicted NAD/FAD-binding protein
MIDRAYERADQLYRNSCKALACLFAVVLALLGNSGLDYLIPKSQWWEVVIIGLIATPLAPVAKDIANAIQTASDAVKSVKG